MDCSLLGFSIHGIFQARILELVAMDRGAWLATVHGAAKELDVT